MRICWYSNAPWAGSGYGVQTALMVERLQRDGHEVAVAANYGLMGTVQNWNGITILPVGLDTYGNDVLGHHARAWIKDQPGWLIGLFDTWVVDPRPLQGLNVAFWTPVDHAEAPPKVAEFTRVPGIRTIAMSEFGRAALGRAGVQADYAPHAFDGRVFRPTVSGIRQAMGVPEDAFLVTVNAANKGNVPPRKAWHENIVAAAELMRRHDDAYLYLHTDPQGPGGIDVAVLCRAAGVPDERLRFPLQYPYRIGAIPSEEVARVYSASDVLLATSYGEGFGVPTIEAQACGLPVVVSDFAASSELAGPGWRVPTQPYWDFSQGAWFGQPLIAGIVDALEQAYAERGQMARREAAMAFAQPYEADAVWESHWRPILARLEAEAVPQTRQQKRAAQRKGGKR